MAVTMKRSDVRELLETRRVPGGPVKRPTPGFVVNNRIAQAFSTFTEFRQPGHPSVLTSHMISGAGDLRYAFVVSHDGTLLASRTGRDQAHRATRTPAWMLTQLGLRDEIRDYHELCQLICTRRALADAGVMNLAESLRLVINILDSEALNLLSAVNREALISQQAMDFPLGAQSLGSLYGTGLVRTVGSTQVFNPESLLEITDDGELALKLHTGEDPTSDWRGREAA